MWSALRDLLPPLALTLAVTSQEAISNLGGDPILSWWDRAILIWNSGNGLAFVLFVAVVLLFTGRVVSGRDRDKTIKDWETRYKENDDRWRERYTEQRVRADNAERMMYQMMGLQARVTTVAERAATVAEVAATNLPPPTPLGGTPSVGGTG